MYRIALASIVLLFAIGTSILSFDNARTRDLQPRFLWPDETTNWYFASRVAAGEPLAVAEPRNQAAGNVIHPRTANVRADGAIVPGAYLGMPLWYGMVGRVVGVRAMLFLTPLLAALGLLAFAAIITRFAGRGIAAIATAFLALHPALWLFTATAFLPNVPFVALLLCGFAVLLATSRRVPPALQWIIGGALVGIALTFRTHEIVWVVAVVCAIAWQQRRGWRALLACAIGASLPFIPILVLNTQLYGSPFTTGYALLHAGGAVPTEFASGGILRTLVAPFGLHPFEAFTRFWEYLVVPYWWFMVLALAAVLRSMRHMRGAICTIVLIVWLILSYGSWTIADPLVRATNVLTISYVRYWVPIVVLLAPWAAIGFRDVVRRAGRWQHAVAALTLLAIALTSGGQIDRDPLEGLRRQRQAIAEHRERARAVIAATPADAVIVSHRMDKVFFSERAVMYVPEVIDADVEQHLHALLGAAPVFWYDPHTPDVAFATLELVGAMPFSELLYRLRAL